MSEVKRDMMRPDGVASYHQSGANARRPTAAECSVREARTPPYAQMSDESTRRATCASEKDA